MTGAIAGVFMFSAHLVKLPGPSTIKRRHAAAKKAHQLAGLPSPPMRPAPIRDGWYRAGDRGALDKESTS